MHPGQPPDAGTELGCSVLTLAIYQTEGRAGTQQGPHPVGAHLPPGPTGLLTVEFSGHSEAARNSLPWERGPPCMWQHPWGWGKVQLSPQFLICMSPAPWPSYPSLLGESFPPWG